MDCDHVFYVLTRGPFPSGAPEDDECQLHLETCVDCWRIAEALRPADDLFQEAVPASESRDLPGYWGVATPPGALIARIAEEASKTAVASSPLAAPRGKVALEPLARTAQRADLLCVAGILLAVLTMPLLGWWLLS